MTEHELNWPIEAARSSMSNTPSFQHTGSNLILDFHGDPLLAKLVVYSDGNHHMALEESLQEFYQKYPDVMDIFYATTPPSYLVLMLERGSIRIGNLQISAKPHLFISPQNILEKLLKMGKVTSYSPYMQSRGNVLLVRKGNPKSIQSIKDLYRNEVRLFISGPKENASHSVYKETLVNLARSRKLDAEKLVSMIIVPGKNVIHSKSIHHREAPQALASDQADVTILYYHLALRFTRIFPHLFEMIPLGGSLENPEPETGNILSHYYIGIVDNGGLWGKQLQNFLLSDRVTEIYQHHGLERFKLPRRSVHRND